MVAENQVTHLVWLRNDLRLHDNDTLNAAAKDAARLIPLYIFDVRLFRKDNYGFVRTGPFRAQFLVESVLDLKRSLAERGCDLVIRFGLPQHIMPQLCREYGVQAVFHTAEPAPYEQWDEQRIADHLPAGTAIYSMDNGELLRSEDVAKLPEMPDIFTEFRKRVERFEVPAPVVAPGALPPLPGGLDAGHIPYLQLNIAEHKTDERASIHFTGGETEALKRLHSYIWERKAVASYYDTRNGLHGEDYSSKFSAWLANGCLSVRQVYHEIMKFEQMHISNQSTYWLKFELLWREFFRFSMRKHGVHYFRKTGLRGKDRKPWCAVLGSHVEEWIDGRTGNEMIDALMKELKSTGYMSNRGRQLVASYLVNDMGLNWLEGAAYFEHILIDYDVCANYGNWAYVAGVGCDPRTNRYFNIEQQAERYDPDKAFRTLWSKDANAAAAL
jgi:deoxyribodipyrimidine photo-lyase